MCLANAAQKGPVASGGPRGDPGLGHRQEAHLPPCETQCLGQLVSVGSQVSPPLPDMQSSTRAQPWDVTLFGLPQVLPGKTSEIWSPGLLCLSSCSNVG